MSANPSSAVYAKLKALGIELPPVSTPAAAYVPFVQTGNLIFMSGHIAKKDGKPWLGQFGKTCPPTKANSPPAPSPLTCWAHCTPRWP
jgi:hypothetical protein